VLEHPQWIPTRALSRAVLLSGVLVLLAVLFGRIDLVALAAPFAIGAAWTLYRRPAAEPQLELELPAEPPAEGTEVTAVLRVVNPDPAPMNLVVVSMAVPRWLPLQPSDRPHATDLVGGELAELAYTGPARAGAGTRPDRPRRTRWPGTGCW
jgi:hypothetical protein